MNREEKKFARYIGTGIYNTADGREFVNGDAQLQNLTMAYFLRSALRYLKRKGDNQLYELAERSNDSPMIWLSWYEYDEGVQFVISSIRGNVSFFWSFKDNVVTRKPGNLTLKRYNEDTSSKPYIDWERTAREGYAISRLEDSVTYLTYKYKGKEITFK